MQSHEEELGDTYSWNFRMGYAYYYLDQEGRALRHFEKALELHPGDDPKLNTRQDMEELIDSCKKGISLPQFWEWLPGTDRDWWEPLRDGSRAAPDDGRGQRSHPRCGDRGPNGGNPEFGFDEISFEMGFNGEKHELILTRRGIRSNCLSWSTSRSTPPRRCWSTGISLWPSAFPEHRPAYRGWLGDFRGGCADLAGGAG